jgi:N-acetylglucosamine-6-phosphate deacetylase
MTKSKVFVAQRVLIEDQWAADQAIYVSNETVTAIGPASGHSGNDAISLAGDVVPGFFDIQVNGGGGVLFNDNPSVEAIEAIGAAHRQFGTTSFLPTLISDDLEKVRAAIDAVDQAIECGVPGVVGIHLEGPFLNEAKKGIHDTSKFRRMTRPDVDLLVSLKNGKTLVTLAPELVDAPNIEALAEAGVIVSAGHTMATYEQAMASVEAGVTGFTHLYNAMSGFESRAPGVVGAAFNSPNTWAGLIADGHHVHPAALRHAIKTKGIERSILVTDAMPTVGSDSDEFMLGGELITAHGGRCCNAEGVLAGSVLDMASAVRYAANDLGFGLSAAVCMASQSPAEFMGLYDAVGSISIGKKADFVVLDDEMNVQSVWIGGENHAF